MKFDDYNISDGIKKSISKMGFKKPTDIQYKSIPAILKGEDVLAIAQTGTGKTAAFAIPILHMLNDRKIERRADGIKCLVMAPTRELALQISKVFEEIGRHTRIKTYCLHGGVEQDKQIKRLQKTVDILVSTPGRMFDLISQGHLRLDRVEILVLDEADHMLDLGFIKDIRDLMRHIPKRRQTLFFSATIDKKIKKLAYSLVRDAIRIQISPKNPVAKNIDHSVTFVEPDDKRFFLERLINENPKSKTLVFVRTKVRAERVKKAMARVNIDTETIHGDIEQKERFNIMEAFNTGEITILIATDVSARGIDIKDVEYVVNYDLPEQTENYVHRVGRTGRAKQKGYAVSFCSSDEKDLLDEIEDYIGSKIKTLKISKEDYSETIDFSAEAHSDWKTLLKEENIYQEALQKKKKIKKKKK